MTPSPPDPLHRDGVTSRTSESGPRIGTDPAGAPAVIRQNGRVAPITRPLRAAPLWITELERWVNEGGRGNDPDHRNDPTPDGRGSARPARPLHASGGRR
jgi:hypothetical protein